MGTLELVQINLLSPIVLAFVLGIIASLIKSDLKLPADIYSALSIYLLLAIGLKGGAELSQTSFSVFWKAAIATLILGSSIPLWSYAIARRIGKFSIADAAALAAHYGSVSAVTFIASQSFLNAVSVPYEGYMATLVALLEVPAIIIALFLASTRLKTPGSQRNWQTALHEILTGKSILLLVGGIFIGLLAGQEGLNSVSPLFVDPFQGALTIFLLELGIVTAKRFSDLPRVGVFLILFGIIMPVIHGVLGVLAAYLANMSAGGACILGVLAASASYIAAPAAVRIALPQANPSYYLTASLAITFPFNLTVGIPLIYSISQFLYTRLG